MTDPFSPPPDGQPEPEDLVDQGSEDNSAPFPPLDDDDDLPPSLTAPPVVVSVPPPPPIAVTAPPPGPVTFPLEWMLEHAAPPIKYRCVGDVAGLSDAARELSWMPFAYPPAIDLALSQRPDGTWSGAMLTVPSARAHGFEGVGTIQAIRRLLEYGWPKDSPPLALSRRVLFRMLAEDDDPSLLFEFGGKSKIDDDAARFARQIMREAAAATLAQAGYSDDPRLRGAARRILDRISDFVTSPLAEKPWVRVGNKQVLAAEAAPPSIYALHMLAHLPLVRTENHASMQAVYEWVTRPLPRQEPVQIVGKKLVPVPHLILGDVLPHRNAVDNDVPFAVLWLELAARLGFLQQHDTWKKFVDRFLDDRDRSGVWHPHKGMAAAKSNNPYAWAAYPLETMSTGDERWTDITFRIGLIARLAGRTIDLV